jgi:hypothetical protein
VEGKPSLGRHDRLDVTPEGSIANRSRASCGYFQGLRGAVVCQKRRVSAEMRSAVGRVVGLPLGRLPDSLGSWAGHDARETSVVRKNRRGDVLSDYRRDAAGVAGIVGGTLRAYDLELAA